MSIEIIVCKIIGFAVIAGVVSIVAKCFRKMNDTKTSGK